MILTLDAVCLVALPILVLIPLSLLLHACIATLKLDCGITLTTEPAPVSLDTILIPPRPSSAMPAQPFTVPFATLPTLLSATPAPLEQLSTMSLQPAPAQLVTSSMELPANSVLITVRLAAHPMELALAVLTPLEEISLKIASAPTASTTHAQLTALPALLLALLAPTELAVPLVMPRNSET